MTLARGTRICQYEILGPLGAGGMGCVYRARDTRLPREVAVKVLREDYARDPDWRGRFDREAQLLAKLNHPNIATVHGLEEVNGARYLVMELVPGQTLAACVKAGPLPLAEALDVCRQIAEALEAAHERGILHRDLKPSNVQITPDGKVKVLDFGLAKSLEPEPEPSGTTMTYEPRTREGAVVGTPAYMAPEQARGKQLDRRCDVWALGCILYEVLTGQRAFAGDTFSDMVAAVIERTPDWEALPAGVPPRVAELVRRCLQKDVRRRLRDAGDVRLEIEEALAELEAGPKPASPIPQVPTPPPTSRRGMMLIGVAAAAGVFVLGMVAQGLREQAPSVPPLSEPRPQSMGHWLPEFLLGGTTRAFGPRLSPDERSLAFLVLHEGQAQVGWMDLASGEWKVLTKKRDRGTPIGGVCWSADSTRIYYDRFFDVPEGVYSVSPSAKDVKELEIIKGAECPQVAADGSLVVCKIDEQGDYRLWRYWPNDRDREGEVFSPPIEFSRGWPSPVRALRTKNEVVFCGKLRGGKETPPKRRFYRLNLDTKDLRPLPGEDLTLSFVQIALTPDDRFVYTLLPAGDAFSMVRIPLEGGRPEHLLPLTARTFGLDVDKAGRVYLDKFHRPLELLRFHVKGGRPERIASTALGWATHDRVGHPVELPDRRVLLPSTVRGRDRLLAAQPGMDPAPLLDQEGDETAPPAVLLDERRLALLVGPKTGRRLTLANLEGDEVRLGAALKSVPTEGLDTLTASHDGKTLYYVRAREVWKISTDESRSPEFVSRGEGVAEFPQTGDLLIQRYEKGSVRLFRVPKNGPESEIKVKSGPLRLVPSRIGGRVIGKDGRILVTATSKDSYFWKVALLDPITGVLERIPVEFDGDVSWANWSEHGQVLGMGFPYESELWRLTPQK